MFSEIDEIDEIDKYHKARSDSSIRRKDYIHYCIIIVLISEAQKIATSMNGIFQPDKLTYIFMAQNIPRKLALRIPPWRCEPIAIHSRMMQMFNVP